MQLDALAARAIRTVSIEDVSVTFADVTPATNASGSSSVNFIFSADSDGVRMDAAAMAALTVPIIDTISFNFGGRLWEARYSATQRFVSERRSVAPYIVVIVLALVFIMAIAGMQLVHIYASD